jgi:hypothetical protein
MAPPARTLFALSGLIVLLVAAACGNGSPDQSGERGNSTIDGLFTVAASPVSEDRLVVDGMVEIEGSLVALASSDSRPAGPVFRSDDGGLSWNESETPLPDAIAGFDYQDHDFSPGAGLVVAGHWLVAFRSTSTVELTGDVRSFGQQAVAVSDDLGATWQLVDLPAPPGAEPFVWTAADVDGRLVLGGATQLVTDLPADRDEAFDVLSEAYDAAFWMSSDPAAGFERLAVPEFDGVPGAQLIGELVAFDGRLIAIGGDTTQAEPGCCYLNPLTVAWESSDGGASWAPMGGLPLPVRGYRGAPRSVLIDGELVLRTGLERVSLSPGSSSWAIQPLPDEYWPDADQIALPDGAAATTWSENGGCDCSVAFAGRLEDGAVVSRTELGFDDCQDESIRGSTASYAPGLIGDQVAALASCDDRGIQPASLAYSADGGMTWATERLTRFAPNGGDLAVESFVFLPEERVLVALLSVLSSPAQAGGLVALRISSTD